MASDGNDESWLLNRVCVRLSQTVDLILREIAAGAGQAGVILVVTGPGAATDTFDCTTDGTVSCTIEDLVPGVL